MSTTLPVPSERAIEIMSVVWPGGRVGGLDVIA